MRLEYAKENILCILHDELIANNIYPEFVEGNDTTVWLTVPDNISEEILNQINSIVEAHNSLNCFKDDKLQEISLACNKAILDGFESSVLGVPHQYGFDMEDQANLMGTLTLLDSGQLPLSFPWKTNDAGALEHTNTQFRQLCLDGYVHKQNNIMKKWTLDNQVKLATTKEEIEAIHW